MRLSLVVPAPDQVAVAAATAAAVVADRVAAVATAAAVVAEAAAAAVDRAVATVAADRAEVAGNSDLNLKTHCGLESCFSFPTRFSLLAG